MAFEQVHPAPAVPPPDSAIAHAIADVDHRLARWHDAMRRAQAAVRAHTARQARAVSGHDGHRPAAAGQIAPKPAACSEHAPVQTSIAESAARHAAGIPAAPAPQTDHAAESRNVALPAEAATTAARGGECAPVEEAAGFESAFHPEDASHEADAVEADTTGEPPQERALPDARPEPIASEAAVEPTALQSPEAAVLDAPPHPAAPVHDEQPPSGETPSAEDEEEALLATLDRQAREAVELKRRWVGPSRSLKDLVEEARRASPAQMAQIRRWRSRS